MTFYQGSDYDGTSYGPWGNGTYKFETDFADNSINSFIATAPSTSSMCIVTLYSGCCPVEGQYVVFNIQGGETRYVNRDTTGDYGSTTIWSDGSLWVSGIVVSFNMGTIVTPTPTMHPIDPS